MQCAPNAHSPLLHPVVVLQCACCSLAAQPAGTVGKLALESAFVGCARRYVSESLIACFASNSMSET
jgi:hypothetical protein